MKLEEEHFKKIVERKLEKIKKDSSINQKAKEVFLGLSSLRKRKEFLIIDWLEF